MRANTPVVTVIFGRDADIYQEKVSSSYKVMIYFAE